MAIKVSIIIPVYNVAPYIEECFRSVMNQTMTEGVECVIVDDCGQDNSMEIAEKLVAEYNGAIVFRILHHDHNRGLSAARNTGIDAAMGEYIYFLDSDDWIYNDCIENLCMMANKYPKADFVQGTISPEDDSLWGWIHSEYNMPSDKDYIDDPCLCRILLQQIHHVPFMQNRLIKKDFIIRNNLYAKEGIVHEDNLWTFMAGKHVHSIAFCKKDTYYYRKSPNSIVSSTKKEVSAKGISIVCDEIMEHISMDKWFLTELRYVIWRIKSIERTGYENPFVFMGFTNNIFLRTLYGLNNKLAGAQSIRKGVFLLMKLICVFSVYLLVLCKKTYNYIPRFKRLFVLDFYKNRICDIAYYLSKFIELLPARRPVWMVCERGDDACDNGLWMFRYLQDNHPEIDSWYVITKDAPNRKNLERYKDHVVTLPSKRFYWLIIRSRCLLAAQCRNYLKHIYVSEKRLWLIQRIVESKTTIRIQHGVIMNDMTWFVKNKYKTDIFICGAKPEYEFIKEKQFYPSNVLRYTGLARYDGLRDYNKNSRTILLMPTWRHSIHNDQEFEDSLYFKTYKNLLRNSSLCDILENNNYNLVFNIHPCFKKYIKHFKELSLPECISIADYENYDVQTLLKESAMLITDYSSVAFDMAYMHKPICYFQFDEKEFRETQFAEGYYKYREGLGTYASDVEELLQHIEMYVNNGMLMLDIHKQRTDKFFILHDQNNCKRIFDETKKLLSR